ncbi:MAG: hypothetical protein WA823_13375 [Candidatus Acidiferrales bacterium]
MKRDDPISKNAQPELEKYDFGTFVEDPPSITQGGRGAVVLTGPSFCITASARVYITTSSDTDAKGGS